MEHSVSIICINESSVTHDGNILFSKDSFSFSSEHFSMVFYVSNIEYILYDDNISINMYKDPVEYTILLKTTENSIKNGINSVIRQWLCDKSVCDLEYVYNKGIPEDLITGWLLDKRFMTKLKEQQETLLAPNKSLKEALRIVAKLDDPEIILELARNIYTIGKIFCMEDEMYASMCDMSSLLVNRLKWLQKYFYNILMGRVNIPALESLLEEEKGKILLELPEIPSKSQIITLFEEINDFQVIKSFIQRLSKNNPFRNIKEIDSTDIPILYYISIYDQKIFSEIIMTEGLLLKVLSFIQQDTTEDINIQLYMGRLLTQCIISPEIKIYFTLPDLISRVFEVPGEKKVHLENNQARVWSDHILGIFQMEILLEMVKSCSAPIKVYIITSGILLSLVDGIKFGTPRFKFLACEIFHEILQGKEKTLINYMQRVNLNSKIQQELNEISGRHTAYTPIIRKITELLRSV
ncbi:hypothetical protein NEAUS07_2116 [Nematocida ausubeli]|nr:hypothetical protein NEAUS07_2116 [Nematocida ausubeli]